MEKKLMSVVSLNPEKFSSFMSIVSLLSSTCNDIAISGSLSASKASFHITLNNYLINDLLNNYLKIFSV